jgi:hypothetical protein
MDPSGRRRIPLGSAKLPRNTLKFQILFLSLGKPPGGGVPPTFEIVTTRKCWAVCSIKSPVARIAFRDNENSMFIETQA